jgi:hypothetical protein
MGSFYNPKQQSPSNLVEPIKNIFYQNSHSRENNSKQEATGNIQIFNNQINNYEIKISQHFLGQNENIPSTMIPEKELLFSPETDTQNKNINFSNLENPINLKRIANKNRKIKNLSLNLKENIFDIPSMRNLKTSESKPNLQNNSNQGISKESTISRDSRGKSDYRIYEFEQTTNIS